MKRKVEFCLGLLALVLTFEATLVPTQADPAMDRARRALERARVEQNMKQVMMSSTASSTWEDISRLPSDFPVKVFRGNQTQFMRMPALEGGMNDVKKLGRHLTVKTRDPAPSVIQWFRTSFASNGLKVNEKYSPPASSNVFSLYGESDKMNVMVAAVPTDEGGGASCQFQVNVSFIQTPAKK